MDVANVVSHASDTVRSGNHMNQEHFRGCYFHSVLDRAGAFGKLYSLRYIS